MIVPVVIGCCRCDGRCGHCRDHGRHRDDRCRGCHRCRDGHCHGCRRRDGHCRDVVAAVVVPRLPSSWRDVFSTRSATLAAHPWRQRPRRSRAARQQEQGSLGVSSLVSLADPCRSVAEPVSMRAPERWLNVFVQVRSGCSASRGRWRPDLDQGAGRRSRGRLRPMSCRYLRRQKCEPLRAVRLRIPSLFPAVRLLCAGDHPALAVSGSRMPRRRLARCPRCTGIRTKCCTAS